MAEGNWWEDFDASLPAFHLSADRLAMVPWAVHAGRQSRPPAPGRSKAGGRLCELCGAAYLGNHECTGGARCPRYYNARRRELEWHQGFWLPMRLVVLWRSTDEEARAREGRAIVAASPGRAPKPPPPMPAPLAVVCLPKPPPWGIVRPGHPPASAASSSTERPHKAPPPLDPRLLVKQPPTRAQLSAYREEQAAQADRRAERETLSLAPRVVPFPEPLTSAFTGQDDTVAAPSESDDATMEVDPGAPLPHPEVLEAQRLIDELGVAVARHLVQSGARGVSSFTGSPNQGEPTAAAKAKGAGTKRQAGLAADGA